MGRFDGAAVARIERQYGAPAIVEQRARTRAALGIRPGERGLDIGCGPGFLLSEMAKDTGPEGQLVGVDTSADMVDTARRRAEKSDLSKNIQTMLGDATRLDFASASFDFVVAVQVYLYVQEIERALGEAARVLKPDGRLVVLDTDWDSCVWLTSDRERHRRIMEARVREFAQPHLPPVLPRLLRAAGLALESVETFAVLETRYDPSSFSGGLIESIPRIVARFGIDPTETERWAADLRGRTGEGDYFFSVNRYLFRARRLA
jgi:ubiquinone/menaquinone biosynthesis C-methylase UbiE